MASYTPYDSKEFAPQSPEDTLKARFIDVQFAVHDLLFKESKLPPLEVPAEQAIIPQSNEVKAYAKKMAKALVTPLALTEKTALPANEGLNEKAIRAQIDEAFDEAFDETAKEPV